MNRQHHRICRQTIEVRVRDRSVAWRLQGELGRIQAAQITGVLDRVCTDLGDPKRVHRIDSIEIDLGRIRLAEVEDVLVERLEVELRKVLAARIDDEAARTEGPGDESEIKAQLELVERFARTGSLPWWADSSRPRAIAEAVETLTRGPTELLVGLVRSLVRERDALRRLVINCGDAQLEPVFAGLMEVFGPEGTACSGQLAELLGALGAKPSFRVAMWMGALRAAEHGGWRREGKRGFWREALSQAALEAGETYESLIVGLGDAMTNDPSANARGTHAILVELRGELRASSSASGASVAAQRDSSFEVAGELDELEAILERLERADVPLADLLAAVRATAGRASAGARHGLLSVLRRLVAAPVGTDELAGTLREMLAGHQDGGAARGGRPGEGSMAAGDRQPGVGSVRTMTRAFGEVDMVCVENAGLVVLWPFIEHLFERLGLVTERRFRGAEASRRAVGLLQHLATGEREPVEYQLPLAKALCGAGGVFEFGPPVTDEEAEECENLLAAAIGHAPILGEMSVDGFRGSFLIRKGTLGVRDGAWLLRVERASYDVVLDRLPWGFGWINLPWMEAPLCVEW